MRYDKLVRDKIPDLIRKNGDEPITHIAEADEHWTRLKAKLQEELDEVLAETDLAGELADLLEVMHAVCAAKGIPFEEIERIRLEKRERRGGFDGRVVLAETRDLPSDPSRRS